MTGDDQRVSVIIPTRNRCQLLRRAVRSVQDQTHVDLEIVIVDDASRDGTAEMAFALARHDRRVVVVRNESATGPAVARNRGIAASHGSLVAFLDDDDEWLPEKLDRQVAYLRARPDVVLVGCQYEIAGARGRARPHRGPTDIGHADLLWCNFIGGASVAVARRSSLPDEPVWDPDLVFGEDWDLFLRCAQGGPVAVLDEILVRYAAHGGARLTTGGRRVQDLAQFVAKHGRYMSPPCREYHQARAEIAHAPTPWLKARRAVGILTAVSPPVRRTLASESINGRIGRLTGDPGRSLRRLHARIRALAAPDQVGIIDGGG